MRNKPSEGCCAIGRFSGLRKLMRAARRGKIPDERIVVILAAEAGARGRGDAYLHSYARRMRAFRQGLGIAT